MKLDPATLSQNRAAAPDMSTWLSANAGSGKTRVLTDRVARLLLEGTDPQNILCLTYTKAAASEMQNRLFQRLGSWAMTPDGALAEDLQKMGVAGVGDPGKLAQARRLFARAIETPGGLRIQTIHSFCSSLLRRFPLEAGVSPAFAEMDDRASTKLREEVADMLAGGDASDAFDQIAKHFTGESLDSLTRDIVSKAEAFAAPMSREQMLVKFGVPPDLTEHQTILDAFKPTDGDLLRHVSNRCCENGGARDIAAGKKMQGLNFDALGVSDIRILQSVFLNGAAAKEPFVAKIGKFPAKAVRGTLGALAEDLDALMARIEAARIRLNAMMATEKTMALHQFADAFLPAYETQKRLRGGLDFDDLIKKTRDLLTDPAVADWVLYRLDGGLDHILVDEAQDTSPTQWQVIECLAREFAAGRGARTDVQRTIFVVGDKKQSIYSFQGADPEGFDRMRNLFRDRAESAMQPFQRRELEYSFRSSDAVLQLVDAVFNSVPDGQFELETSHRAFRDKLPGRVDLWPPVPRSKGQEKQNWFDPVDVPANDHHDIVLARNIAQTIQRTIGTETIPLSNGTRRLVQAGDFLILVRRRKTLFTEIIRSCKALGLPVAGADRLKLGGEIAVKDLGAVLSFLATPEDDLSLAAALRSPLFGWSESDLYELAAGRSETYLWASLRNASSYPETMQILNDLRAQADFLRPYDLVERLLSRHDGRRRLLARLGPEAEDGIDSLLSQALAYEQREVPSLTGFLGWLETDDVEVKRQLDSAGDHIRVMTVHGAKGLESPIVVLPDTAKRVSPIRDEILELQDGTPVWRTTADTLPTAMAAAIDEKKQSQAAEDLRLLYVAMTRAETWLIAAAAGDVGEGRDSWHAQIQRGLEALDPVELDTPTGPGLRSFHLDWDAGPVETKTTTLSPDPMTPDWIDLPIKPLQKVKPISPSDLGGAKVLGSDDSIPESEDALRHGRQVHLLLEHLPDVPKIQRRPVASALLAQGGDPAEGEALDAILEEASKTLDHPDFAWLFGPGVLSEVDLSARIDALGDGRLHGTIDKLLVSEERVMAVDFKTNKEVPDDPRLVPEGLLRQMAAYDAALCQIYPGRVIDTAILWTRLPVLMPLPHEIVRATLHSGPTS